MTKQKMVLDIAFLIKDIEPYRVIESSSPLIDHEYLKKIGELFASPPIDLKKPDYLSATTSNPKSQGILLKIGASKLMKKREEKKQGLDGGGYYEKYIKYKFKYMELKNKIS